MHRLALVLLVVFLVACDSGEPGVANANSTVTVAYEGRLTDGQLFDSSSGSTFSLRQVIPGFRDGIVGMMVGETKTFEVPPEEGYGNNPPPTSIIPPGATLIFTVELLDVR
ncbi:MAG: FKBP-type peptidyl-prolyl cis-trans isomerase [Bacteroidota bacterium]